MVSSVEQTRHSNPAWKEIWQSGSTRLGDGFRRSFGTTAAAVPRSKTIANSSNSPRLYPMRDSRRHFAGRTLAVRRQNAMKTRMTSASFRVYLAAPFADAAFDPGTAAQTPPAGPAGRFAVAMAQAQHGQALAGHRQQISAKGGLTRLNEGRVQPGDPDSPQGRQADGRQERH
jgi:hypothetical protein